MPAATQPKGAADARLLPFLSTNLQYAAFESVLVCSVSQRHWPTMTIPLTGPYTLLISGSTLAPPWLKLDSALTPPWLRPGSAWLNSPWLNSPWLKLDSQHWLKPDLCVVLGLVSPSLSRITTQLHQPENLQKTKPILSQPQLRRPAHSSTSARI